MSAPTPEDMAKWPVPNYDNPHDPFDPVIYGIEAPLIVLMTAFIVGRFYSRSVLVKNALGVDDWVMLAAYVLCTAMTACHLYSTQVGIGRHLYDVRVTSLGDVGKFTLITMAIFGPACAITKISICLTYLRLFPSQSNKYINWGTIVVMAGWGIATFLVMMFQCSPLSDVWAAFTPREQRNCINTEIFYIISAAINSITDILVYLYPITYLWKVRLSLTKRLSLIACFSLGAIVTIAGAFRIWLMVIFFDTWDQTYYGAIIFMVLAIEVDLGIVFGCLPAMRPIMVRIFPKSWGTSADRSASNIHINKSSALVSSRGFRGLRSIDHDPNSIHVQKDVELSISPKAYGGYPRRDHGREGSEEWVFQPDNQRG